jgi:hypothetical protein
MSTITIDISASDIEPGTVVLEIKIDEGSIPIPLRGENLCQFANNFRDACMLAFKDQLPKDLQPLGDMIEQLAKGEYH